MPFHALTAKKITRTTSLLGHNKGKMQSMKAMLEEVCIEETDEDWQ